MSALFVQEKPIKTENGVSPVVVQQVVLIAANAKGSFSSIDLVLLYLWPNVQQYLGSFVPLVCYTENYTRHYGSS